MKKEIVCIVCPLGCNITVEAEGKKINSITGYSCQRGALYGENEYLHPVRILTSTAATDNKRTPLVPLKSRSPIPKEKMMDCMVAIRKLKVKLPVEAYDVLISNVCGTGIDIVATASVGLGREE